MYNYVTGALSTSVIFFGWKRVVEKGYLKTKSEEEC